MFRNRFSKHITRNIVPNYKILKNQRYLKYHASKKNKKFQGTFPKNRKIQILVNILDYHKLQTVIKVVT